MTDVAKILKACDDYLISQGRCTGCGSKDGNGIIWESGKGVMPCPKCGDNEDHGKNMETMG